MPVYLPIKPKERLYQEIVDQIQQQVLSGALKPGDQIPAERDLAERFGVSRTAVREAIKSLTEKGLIEVFVGRGTFVTTLSPDRVVESMTLLLRNEPDSVANLQEARVLVEVPTARLAALRRTNEHLERLRTICDEMEQERSVSPRLIDGDTEFHVQVARASGNSVLVLLSQTIVELLRAERLEPAYLDESALSAAFAGHRAIVDAIAAGDAEQAGQAMHDHLNHVTVARRALDDAGLTRVAS
ncbi:MAG TPA: FadR/GntR family transcriptional regulator [Gemmatimonadaceae bacterium]|nr:FadR/GntR family transcriptional regulator [Gemmatimonadaceae bacterium]